MYLLVRGTALEIQDKLAGKVPVLVDEFVTKEVEVPTGPASDPVKTEMEVPVPTKYRVTGVITGFGLQNVSDDIFVQAVDATAEKWEDGPSSDSTSAE